jgi:cellulose synthase (UDP-forming)
VYVLDDSNQPKDIKNMQELAHKHGATLVRRDGNEGYKAGNINNAIKHHVSEEFFVILDADQAPEPEFLLETMDHFSDPQVAFVQTPQHFINDATPLERAVKVGTNIFYQTLCVSKARDGAMPFCGTNAVTRTSAFRAVNGFSYYTATEDIELGMRFNELGMHGEYVPKILAHGYAPHDYKAFSSQQYRWANGNLAILRESWLRLLRGDYSLRYLFHTFFTLGWWLIGFVTFAYILVPLLSFFLGGTHHTWLPTWMLLATYPYVLVGIMMVFVSLHNRTDEKVTFQDAFLQYSLLTNSMFIYARAAANALVGRYIGFVRTSKRRSSTGLGLIKWNLLLAAVCFGFSIYAVYHAAIAPDFIQFRTYLPISLWLLFYSVVLSSSILFIGRKTA